MSDPVVTLEPLGDGQYLARWHRRRLRFLFSDGSTVDVESYTDGSTLRSALLDIVGRGKGPDFKIVGVADLDPPAPKKAARKAR